MKIATLILALFALAGATLAAPTPDTGVVGRDADVPAPLVGPDSDATPPATEVLSARVDQHEEERSSKPQERTLGLLFGLFYAKPAQAGKAAKAGKAAR